MENAILTIEQGGKLKANLNNHTNLFSTKKDLYKYVSCSTSNAQAFGVKRQVAAISRKAMRLTGHRKSEAVQLNAEYELDGASPGPTFTNRRSS